MTVCKTLYDSVRCMYIFQLLTWFFSRFSRQAIHEGMDCMQYQKYSLREATDENSKKTQEWIAVINNTGAA